MKKTRVEWRTRKKAGAPVDMGAWELVLTKSWYIPTRGDRLCPPYTDVPTKFWKPQARLKKRQARLRWARGEEKATSLEFFCVQEEFCIPIYVNCGTNRVDLCPRARHRSMVLSRHSDRSWEKWSQNPAYSALFCTQFKSVKTKNFNANLLWPNKWH